MEYIKNEVVVKRVLIGLGIVACLMVTFYAGTIVGYQKAKFAGGFGDNYEQNFFGSRGDREHGFVGGMMHRFDLPPSGHGVIGEVVSVTLPTLVVVGQDRVEKMVALDDTTMVRKFQENAETTGITVGSFVAVLGDPDDRGVITAKLIRLLPPPPQYSVIENTQQ